MNKGYWVALYKKIDNLENLKHDINERKRIITEYKLDLLFELDNEEVILNEFQTYKDQLEELLAFAVEFQTYFDRDNKKIPIMNEETGENTYIPKKGFLKDKQKQLNQLINTFKKNIKDNCLHTDLIILLTEWDEFKSIDFKKAVKKKKFKIYDLRNIYTRDEMKRNRIMYYSIGRPDVN